MPSKKLENFSKTNPSLAPYINKLYDYLRYLSEHDRKEIIPRVAAVQLGLSEADTLGLLTLFQDAGLVKPRYDIVCTRTDSVIDSVYSLDEVPDKVDCQICDRQHEADDVRVELVFEIAQGLANAAA